MQRVGSEMTSPYLAILSISQVGLRAFYVSDHLTILHTNSKLSTSSVPVSLTRSLESLYSSQHIASSISTHHPVLELAILSTNTSVAPQAVSSSIALAILSFSTIELTAAHSGSSSAWIVGARFPGVIFVAFSRRRRGMLYMQRTYFCAAEGDVY